MIKWQEEFWPSTDLVYVCFVFNSCPPPPPQSTCFQKQAQNRPYLISYQKSTEPITLTTYLFKHTATISQKSAKLLFLVLNSTYQQSFDQHIKFLNKQLVFFWLQKPQHSFHSAHKQRWHYLIKQKMFLLHLLLTCMMHLNTNTDKQFYVCIQRSKSRRVVLSICSEFYAGSSFLCACINTLCIILTDPQQITLAPTARAIVTVTDTWRPGWHNGWYGGSVTFGCRSGHRSMTFVSGN